MKIRTELKARSEILSSEDSRIIWSCIKFGDYRLQCYNTESHPFELPDNADHVPRPYSEKGQVSACVLDEESADGQVGHRRTHTTENS